MKAKLSVYGVMMSKQTFILVNDMVRRNAQNAIVRAPEGYMVEIKPPVRNLDQNAKLWAMLSDVSKQVIYHGKKLGTEDWKSLFTGSLRKFELMPSIDGNGWVMLGEPTSKMSKKRFAELIEMIYAFGAENHVVWSEKSIDGFEQYMGYK